jgi:hypothetical protein
MAGIAAIRVDDEQDVSCGATNRLYTDLAIIAAFVLSLERRTREDAGGVIEANPRARRVRRLLASSHSKIILKYTL